MKKTIQAILDKKINEPFVEKKVKVGVICDHVNESDLLSETAAYLTVAGEKSFLNTPTAKQGFVSLISGLLIKELGIPGLKVKLKFNNSN